eukprot:g20615.t1
MESLPLTHSQAVDLKISPTGSSSQVTGGLSLASSTGNRDPTQPRHTPANLSSVFKLPKYRLLMSTTVQRSLSGTVSAIIDSRMSDAPASIMATKFPQLVRARFFHLIISNNTLLSWIITVHMTNTEPSVQLN